MHLPAFYAQLPRSQLLQTFHPPLSFVYQYSNVSHRLQSLLNLVIVRMIGFRVLQQLRQLKRVLANSLDRRQQISVQRDLYEASHQPTGLEKFTVTIVLVELLQHRRGHRMAVAIFGIHAETRSLKGSTSHYIIRFSSNSYKKCRKIYRLYKIIPKFSPILSKIRKLKNYKIIDQLLSKRHKVNSIMPLT